MIEGVSLMKRMLIVLASIYLALILAACASNKVSPLIIKDSGLEPEILEDDSIVYRIEQIILTKGFQNLEPKVEILKRDDGFRLLASLGLVETSGVNIKDINKTNNEINIHVENQLNSYGNQIAIPQILIELPNINLRSIENYTLNIINENYQPIKVKLSANEAISKVNADFQIATNTSPDIDIIKKGDSLLWKLNYKNILDKHNPETPVVDMAVTIDANTGELIESSKEFLSALIDEGSILDYIPNDYILYMKDAKGTSDSKKSTDLWIYDIENNTRELIYTTNSKIISAQFSPSLDSISVLESIDGANRLYVIIKDEIKVFRAMFDSSINPLIARWKDEENIYILSKSNTTSSIYNYNIKDGTTDLVNYMYADITGMQIQDEDVILTIKDEETEETYIQMSSNWINYKMKSEGYSPSFINDKLIGFLKFDEEADINRLFLLNMEDSKLYSSIDLNVSKYFEIDENTLGIVSDNKNNNDYTFHKYDIENKNLEEVANISSSQAYYDSEREVLYIDLKVPFESSKPQIIYSLNLDKKVLGNPR